MDCRTDETSGHRRRPALVGPVQSTADLRAVLSKRVVFGVDVIEREAPKGAGALLVFAARGLPATCNIGPQTGWFLGRRLSVQGRPRLSRLSICHRSGAAAEYPDKKKWAGVGRLGIGLLRLHGTAFGALDANEFLPANAGALLGSPAPPFRTYRDGTTLSDVADAVIYRGKVADAVVRPDPSYAADTAYAAELKRRAGFAGVPPPGARGGSKPLPVHPNKNLIPTAPLTGIHPTTQISQYMLKGTGILACLRLELSHVYPSSNEGTAATRKIYRPHLCHRQSRSSMNALKSGIHANHRPTPPKAADLDNSSTTTTAATTRLPKPAFTSTKSSTASGSSAATAPPKLKCGNTRRKTPTATNRNTLSESPPPATPLPSPNSSTASMPPAAPITVP